MRSGKSSSLKQNRRETNIHTNNFSSSNESRTFCVSMLKSGEAVTYDAKSAKDILPRIKNVDFTWINFQVDDLPKDGPAVASELGFSPHIISNLVKQHISSYEDTDTELGLLLPAVHINEFNVSINKLIIAIRGNVVLTLHDARITRLVKLSRYATTFFKKIPRNIKTEDKISYLLVRILEENNERNFDAIRHLQEQGEIMSKFLIEPTTQKKDLGRNIYEMKSALITYLEVLWAALDVIQYLRYGDAEQITNDTRILQRFGLLVADITRQISITEQMSTVLASGLEVLQGIYNNQLTILNNRLSLLAVWLAVLGTAFIVPNTIATVFGTPIGEHLGWRAMLWILALSTVLSVIIVYLVIRKKHLFPQKME